GVVVDEDGVEDVVAELVEVRAAGRVLQGDEVADEGDGGGVVWADEGVDVGVVGDRILADLGGLPMRRHHATPFALRAGWWFCPATLTSRRTRARSWYVFSVFPDSTVTSPRARSRTMTTMGSWGMGPLARVSTTGSIAAAAAGPAEMTAVPVATPRVLRNARLLKVLMFGLLS